MYFFGVLFTVLTYIYTPFYCSFAKKASRKTCFFYFLPGKVFYR